MEGGEHLARRQEKQVAKPVLLTRCDSDMALNLSHMLPV
jgi:hypothetical protein